MHIPAIMSPIFPFLMFNPINIHNQNPTFPLQQQQQNPTFQNLNFPHNTHTNPLLLQTHHLPETSHKTIVNGFSGRPANEVLRVSPDFVALLGLQQKLTLSRNNGFLNMLKLMQEKALLLHMEAKKGASEISSISISDSKDDSFVENSSDSPATKSPLPSSDVGLSSELDDKDIELGGRGKRVKEMLEKELDPVELQIEDVSYQHAGHAGVRGSIGETHFNLKVVSKEFEGKSLIKRLRLIYNLLQEELPSGPHALSIVGKTPSEVNEG